MVGRSLATFTARQLALHLRDLATDDFAHLSRAKHAHTDKLVWEAAVSRTLGKEFRCLEDAVEHLGMGRWQAQPIYQARHPKLEVSLKGKP